MPLKKGHTFPISADYSFLTELRSFIVALPGEQDHARKVLKTFENTALLEICTPLCTLHSREEEKFVCINAYVLRQKKFTVDFLTKKQKVNEGEVPQYYIEQSHEPIIDPVEWDAVQDEMKRRKSIGRAYSGMSALSAKIVCGDCGEWYGLKTWHSSDKYKTVVWQCNRKYDKEKHQCTTPHLTDEEIKARFLKVYNGLIEKRKTVLETCRFVKDQVTDTSAIDSEMETLLEEITLVTELTRKCVNENTEAAQNQADYAARYNGYVERYEKAKSRYAELAELREAKETKGRAVDRFASALAGHTEPVTVFDDFLWLTAVDRVTVRNDGVLVFRFYGGGEYEG
jgi:site-specific DNA recombinase